MPPLAPRSGPRPRPGPGLWSLRITIAVVLSALCSPHPCCAQGRSASEMYAPYPLDEGTILEVQAVERNQALLPCDIASDPGDSVFLVVWYKDKDEITPIYSYDVRGKDKDNAQHWNNKEVVGNRTYFRTASEPATLSIDSVQVDDAGHYRCRVDFRASPTRNTRVRLTVIVPPGQPTIVDQSGAKVEGSTPPYIEGQSLELTCFVYGGHPPATLSWWRGSQRLESTDTTSHQGGGISNKLHVPKLTRRHLNEKLQCQASNNNISMPLTTTVTINLILRPLSVAIQPTVGDQPLSATKKVQMVCHSTGSRPPAKMSWWKDGKRLDSRHQLDSAEGNITKSVLNFIPTQDDNGKKLGCRAENPLLLNSALTHDIVLNVFYPPAVRLHLGKSLNPRDIEEGDDVYFSCKVDSNPQAYKVVWKHNGMPVQGNSKGGVILSSADLALQTVTRAQAGNYSCVASNVEGDGTSNLVGLHVMYKPVCAESQKRVYGVARQEVAKILCQVSAYPSADSFRWAFNNSGEALDMPATRYATVPLSGSGAGAHLSGSVLTYVPSSELDYGTVMCWASNAAGSQRDPCVFHIIAAGKPDTPFNCSLLNQTSSALGVECMAGFDGGQPQWFQLEVFEGSRRLLANLSSALPSFQVSGLAPGLALRMLVYAVNSKGRSEAGHLEGFTLKSAEKQTGSPELTITPLVGGLLGAVVILVLATGVALAVLRRRAAGGGSSGRGPQRPARPAQLPLKDKAALPLRSEVEDLQPYSDKDDRNPDLIPCNKDSDYQLGSLGQKKGSPDSGGLLGEVHATLRNGDVFCKQDNREAERERYISRQDEEVTYAELVLAAHGGRPALVSSDANGGATLRRVVATADRDREPTIYAQIDHARKAVVPTLVGTPMSPAGPGGVREIVTVRTPLMSSQQESCV